MKKQEQASIELYMYSLNQEFPVGKGHLTYLKRYSELKPDLRGDVTLQTGVESQVFQVKTPGTEVPRDLPADWSVKWLSNKWIQNDAMAIDTGDDFDPLKSAVVRKEEFGGILFDPRADRVYKLNHRGVQLFHAMRERYRAGRSMDSAFEGFGADEVATFTGAMRAAGLLPS
jgi:hypothetical protein